MVRTIYQQLSPAEVHGQLDRVVEQLREPFAQVAELLADARAGHPGLHGLPSGPLAEAVVQQPAGTAEPGDKAPQSLPPKGDVVGIFPNRLSARRLVGAVLAEQHDEWAEARRYLTIPNAAGNEALPDAQYAGRSGLINIKRDDALLHYLTGHYQFRNDAAYLNNPTGGATAGRGVGVNHCWLLEIDDAIGLRCSLGLSARGMAGGSQGFGLYSGR